MLSKFKFEHCRDGGHVCEARTKNTTWYNFTRNPTHSNLNYCLCFWCLVCSKFNVAQKFYQYIWDLKDFLIIPFLRFHAVVQYSVSPNVLSKPKKQLLFGNFVTCASHWTKGTTQMIWREMISVSCTQQSTSHQDWIPGLCYNSECFFSVLHQNNHHQCTQISCTSEQYDTVVQTKR